MQRPWLVNNWADTLGFYYCPYEEGKARDRYDNCLCGEEVTARVRDEPEGNLLERVVGLHLVEGKPYGRQ